MLSKNLKETEQQLIASDKAFNFMNTIKESPTYWKNFLH